MSFVGDLKILYRLVFPSNRGATHAERLENFYGAQAENYDSFRQRLLKGRQEMMDAIPVPQGGVWVDMGGGTGANVERLGDKIHQLHSVYIVDLSKSLLDIAKRRANERGWKNVHAVEADATTFAPPEGQADVVTFSYSLTMIPDWFAAVEHAHQLLKPGGLIGVVDFYISRKYPADGQKKHSGLTRAFWPLWFGHDNVFPSPDHLPFLQRRFAPVELHEERGTVPFLPLVRVPYYWFVGRKEH